MAQSDRINQLRKIISALEQFQTRKNSLFSLDKLANYLSLSERDMEEVLELVFRFQGLFSSMFEGYILVKKWKNEKIYLALKLKNEVKNLGILEPKEIEIDKEQAELLNDMVYYFQHVKIGKGFNVKSNGTELSKKVKQFNRSHPYFFEHRGNGLIYPSKLAVEAGNLIRVVQEKQKNHIEIRNRELLNTNNLRGKNFKSRKDEFIEYHKSIEDLNHFQNYPFFMIVWEVLWHTQRFYIFNKWDALIELFNKYQMTSFLDFIQISFKIFKTISDKHTDIDIIMKIIIKLSKVMDEIDYENLIFNNQSDEKHQNDLKKFVTELEKDELILDENQQKDF